jgi:Tfp pilus assembly protein PilF
MSCLTRNSTKATLQEPSGGLPAMRFGLLPVVLLMFCFSTAALCQDSAEEGTMTRGSRAELAVTVLDDAGHVIGSSAIVKLYKDGIPIDQASTVRGRAFFVPRSFGDFTVVVEATGYKSAQKDVTVVTAIRAEVDINLQRSSGSSEPSGVPGPPVLAPKAKEELVKGLQALGQNKLDSAQKHVSAAMKLAPNNPEVLYVQGMVYLKRADWANAQTVLEKSSQLDPSQARVFAALGIALCDQQKYQDAIPALEKATQMEPNPSWETELALGKSYYYTQQYDQALKLAQQANTSSHGAPQAELLLAQCLTAVGRYEDSAQVLRGVLKNNANTPDAATAQRWLNGLIANGKIQQESSSRP